MSTDLSSPSLADLLDRAKLRGTQVFSHAIDREIELAETSLAEIWEHPDHRHYTDHGLGHSHRIIEYALGFFERYRFSALERAVFFQAALVHDMGMQFNSWGSAASRANEPGSIANLLHLPEPELDLEEVRRQHVPFADAYLQAELDGRRTWEWPRPLMTAQPLPRTIFSWSAIVAAAHSGRYMWDRMLHGQHADHQDRKVGGESLRPRLLAGLLRLCDELDGQWTRVTNIEQLWSDAIAAKSRLHWLAAYFVESVEVDIRHERAEIRLSWRCPVRADEETRERIRRLVELGREQRIARTAEEVNEFFYRSRGNKMNCMEISVTGLDAEPSTERLQVSSSLQSLLRQAEDVFSSPEKVRSSDVDWRNPEGQVGGATSPLPVVDRSDIIVQSSDLDAVDSIETDSFQRRLVQWFRENRRQSHTELERGTHTNVFLQCRKLAADAEMVQFLSERIVEVVDTKGVDLVVGIGTSMVPLAVAVALRLDAKFTYTYRGLSVGALEGPRRSEVDEAVVVESGNGRVLLIDDIISFGVAAAEVIDKVARGSSGAIRRKVKGMVHVSLFRLGTEEVQRVPSVTYHELVTIPDVYYAKSRDTCRLCRDGEPLRFENDRPLEL